MTKQTTPARADLIFGFFLVALLCIPCIASAGPPFGDGTQSLSNDLITILAPIAGIAVMAVAALCWFGKISWWWFVGIVIGIVLFFGKDQVVTWIRGLFGV
ncbi:TrbC/VirB2 family protein [Xylella fastidiosa]|uniref:TrbC/VirB2 family protein n=1 Tax=Xylella fastidiosa TaxID=2371 RepID=UPI001124C2DD|nr:TrbC/VirB2 family protein [Xylella fastidiosa]TNW18205.1 transposase [Xylella fastidiosa subsp. pauca]